MNGAGAVKINEVFNPGKKEKKERKKRGGKYKQATPRGAG